MSGRNSKRTSRKRQRRSARQQPAPHLTVIYSGPTYEVLAPTVLPESTQPPPLRNTGAAQKPATSKTGAWVSAEVFTGLAIAVNVFLAIPGIFDFLDWHKRLGFPFAATLILLASLIASRSLLLRRKQLVMLIAWVVATIMTVFSIGSAVLRAHSEVSLEEFSSEVSVANSGLDLVDKEIKGNRFTDADLRESRIQYSTLTDVDFRGSDLSASDLRGSKFNQVNLSGVSMCGVDARGADLSQSTNFLEVVSFDWFVYDETTKFPENISGEALHGALNNVRENMLYSCSEGDLKIMRSTD